MSFIANNIRAGNVIRHKGGIWRVVQTEHVKPGKGGAFMQLELKNIITGTKLDERFRSQENVDKLIFESIPATFLYADGDNLEFMCKDSFEQVSVPSAVIGHRIPFLQDGMDVELERIDDGEIVGVKLPLEVTLKVTDTDPCMKHQTVTASFKSATLDNGVVVQVPQFIDVGDDIIVKVEDCSYIGRDNSTL